MPVVAVVGAQWGDEGKGKIIDMLADKANVVARYSGGANAGHTVINRYGEFRLHLVPSGIFHPQTICIIGNGVVLDPGALLEEMEMLQGFDLDMSRLHISERAHLVMPYHMLLDSLEEESRGGGAIGTTRKGIGPAYTDKVARMGIRAGDLLDRDLFYERLRFVLEYKNQIITKVYGRDPVSLEETYERYCDYADRLRPFIDDITGLVREALRRDDYFLLEGAQGTMLDLDFGTYPYVTSSSPSIGGACLGLGIGPNQIDCIMGIVKAYTTRIGSGPMPTELLDDTGQLIRERACEYGATTGRPRRCGWFDSVAARYSAQVNGLTSVALTRLDILDVLPSIKVCTSYKVDGVICDHLPSNLRMLEACQPVYEELPGWQQDISNVRRFDDLPEAAKSYVHRLEELIGCPIDIISVGASREQTIIVREVW